MATITDEFKEKVEEKAEKIECNECGAVFLGAPTEKNLDCDSHPF